VNGTTETFAITGPMQSGLVVPTNIPHDGSPWQVSLSAKGIDSLQAPIFLLDRIEIGSARYTRTALQADAWWMLPAALFPFALFLGLHGWAPNRARRQAGFITLGAAIISAVFVSLSTRIVGFYAGTFFAVALPVVIGEQFLRQTRGSNRVRATDVLAGAMAVSVIAWLRWSWVCALQYQPIPADAIHYLDIARRMPWPYATQPREPLFMWLVWLHSTATAWGPLSMRTLTFLLSLAEGATLFALSRRFMPLFPATVVVLLYAFNPFLANSAALGLREELFPLAIMVFLLGLNLMATSPRGRFALGLAVVGAIASVLTRFNALAVVVPLFAFQSWRIHLGWKKTIWSAVVFLSLVLPLFITSAVRSGDPMISSSIVAHYYRNAEFVGKPGYPTQAQLNKDAFAGPPISMGEYLFGLHKTSEVFSATGLGAWRMIVGKPVAEELLRTDSRVRADSFGNLTLPESRPWRDRAVFILYILGGILCWRRPGLWMVPATIIGLVLPLGFLAGKGLLVTRLMVNPVPLMLILAGAAIAIVWAEFSRFRVRLTEPSLVDPRDTVSKKSIRQYRRKHKK
jgi:hypothetical protein